MASGSADFVLLERDSAGIELLERAETGGVEVEQPPVAQPAFPRCNSHRAAERGANWTAEQEEWQRSRLAWARHLFGSHESSESGSAASSLSPEVPEERTPAGSPSTEYYWYILILQVLAPMSLAFLLGEALAHYRPTRTVHEYLAVACIIGAIASAIIARFLAYREVQRLQAILVGSTGSTEELQASSALWTPPSIEQASQRLLAAKQVFNRFLPHQVVSGIMNGSVETVQVSDRTVTVMFCDIRNYTMLCRAMEGDALLQFLQRYLTVMCRVVRLFKGTVAEIQGDGILAFWNADTEVEEHATRAVAAACAMEQALTCLNEEFRQQGMAQIAAGFAVHTGHGLTGIIGCKEKLKWGCLGDVVNVTSRLETLCKHYGVSIICSSATQERLAPNFHFRPLDRVAIRGIDQPLTIYHIAGITHDMEAQDSSAGDRRVEELYREVQELGLRLTFDDSGPWPFTWNVTPEQEEELDLYAAGLACFHEGRFQTALAICHAILNLRPQTNNVAALLAERAETMAQRQRLGQITPEELEQWMGTRSFR